jgi:hypothetical protein
MLTIYRLPLGLVVLVAAVVFLSGIKKQPGIGIILSVIILGVAISCGAIITTIFGLFLGDISIWSANNLWMLILPNSVMAYIGLFMISFNQDTRHKKTFGKKTHDYKTQFPPAKDIRICPDLPE